MKPEARGTPGKDPGWFGRVNARVQRFINGGPAPTDPLYLSNRSPWQRSRLALVIAVPLLIVASCVVLSLTFLTKPVETPVKELTPAEIAARTLPNLAKNISMESNKDIEVLEVHVDRAARTTVSGTVRNHTDRSIREAEIVFWLTQKNGSQVGAVTTTLRDLAPRATAKFAFPIQQDNAHFALVREIHTQ